VNRMTRGRNRKPRRKTLSLLAVLLVFVAIIALGVYQSRPQPKKPAAEYFEIFDAGVNPDQIEFLNPTEDQGGSYENSSVMIIYGIYFKIRAIGGDAHDVIVKSWATAPEEYFEKIVKGQYAYYSKASNRPGGYYSEKEGGKFPFEVGIWSWEAEGTIKIYL